MCNHPLSNRNSFADADDGIFYFCPNLLGNLKTHNHFRLWKMKDSYSAALFIDKWYIYYSNTGCLVISSYKIDYVGTKDEKVFYSKNFVIENVPDFEFIDQQTILNKIRTYMVFS